MQPSFSLQPSIEFVNYSAENFERKLAPLNETQYLLPPATSEIMTIDLSKYFHTDNAEEMKQRDLEWIAPPITINQPKIFFTLTNEQTLCLTEKRTSIPK